MLNPKRIKPEGTSDVFGMSVDELREEYEATTGRTATDDGYRNKPTIKAILLLEKAGAPADLHAELLDQVRGFSSMRLEHLRSYVFQRCRIPVASLTRQQLAVAAVRRAWQRVAKK